MSILHIEKLLPFWKLSKKPHCSFQMLNVFSYFFFVSFKSYRLVVYCCFCFIKIIIPNYIGENIQNVSYKDVCVCFLNVYLYNTKNYIGYENFAKAKFNWNKQVAPSCKPHYSNLKIKVITILSDNNVSCKIKLV